MNTNYPHDILPLAEVPENKLDQYVPLSDADFAKLRYMTPHERGRWIAENHQPKQLDKEMRAKEPSPEEQKLRAIEEKLGAAEGRR